MARSEAPATGESRREQLPPPPTATAPVVDSTPTQCAYIGLWRGGAARPLRTPGIPRPGGVRGRAEAIAPAPRRRRRSRRNAAPRAPPAACRRRSSPAGRGGRRCLCAAVAWPEMSLPAAVARSFRWPARPPSFRCYHCSAQRCRRPATPAPGASDDRPARDRRQPDEGALVEQVVHVAGLTKKCAEIIVDTVFGNIVAALRRGGAAAGRCRAGSLAAAPRKVARGEHGRQVVGRELTGLAAAAIACGSPVAGEYPGGPLAGRVRLAGELRAEAGRGHRHRGAARGAATVVELGEVGGEAHVIERAPGEPGVTAAPGAGVGAAGISADRGVDQAARRGRRAADGRSGRGDHG